MPYVRDIAKMPQNIISPQALTTGTLLAEKEGVSDGHQSPHLTSPHRHVTCTLPPVFVGICIVSHM